METGAWRIFGGQRSSSEAENFHSMCEALGLILPIQKGKRIKKSLNCCIYNIYTSSQPSDLFISCLGLLVLLSELGFVLQTWFFFLTVFRWLLLTLLSSSLHLLFYLLPSSPDKCQLPPSSKVSNHVGEQVGTVELSESVLSVSLLLPPPPSPQRVPFPSSLGESFFKGSSVS